MSETQQVEVKTDAAAGGADPAVETCKGGAPGAPASSPAAVAGSDPGGVVRGAPDGTTEGTRVQQCLNGFLDREERLSGFQFMPEHPDESLGTIDAEQWRWSREGARLREEASALAGPEGKGAEVKLGLNGDGRTGKAAGFPEGAEARAAYAAAALFPGQTPTEFVRLARMLAPARAVSCGEDPGGNPVPDLTRCMELSGLGMVSNGGRRAVGFVAPHDGAASRSFLRERYPVVVMEGLSRVLESGLLRDGAAPVLEGMLVNLQDVGQDDPGLLRLALDCGVGELFPPDRTGSGERLVPSDQRRVVERFVRLVGAVMRVPLEAREREELLLDGLGGLVRRGAVGLFGAVTEAITEGCPPSVLVELYRRMDEAVAGNESERRVLQMHLWRRMVEPIPEGDLGFWQAMVGRLGQPGGGPFSEWFGPMLEDAWSYHLVGGTQQPLLFAVLSRGRGGVVGRMSARVLGQFEGGEALTAPLAAVLDAVGLNGRENEVRTLHPLCGLLRDPGFEPGPGWRDAIWSRLLLEAGGRRLGERGLHVLAGLERWRQAGEEAAAWATELYRSGMGVVLGRLDARGRHAAVELCAGLLRQTADVRQECSVLHRMTVVAERREWLAWMSRAAATVGRPVPVLRAAFSEVASGRPADGAVA